MSLFDSVSASIGKEIGGSIGAMTSSIMGQAASKFVPTAVTRAVNAAGNIGGKLLNGDLIGAGMGVLNSGILGDLGGLGGIARQAAFWGGSTPMFANVSPAQAKSIFKESIATTFAQKNWFVLEVSSPLQGDISSRFNLMASDVEYAPSTITAEKRKVGGTTVDSVQSSEPVELTITTLDNDAGFLKNWFNAHAHAAVRTDGTIGYPADYAINIKVVHGYPFGEYEDIGLFRPQNMQISLSRKEDAMQEITMTFSQLDTFMRP